MHVDRGGDRGGPPRPTEVARAARGRDRARCRSGTTQDEIHYSFFAALTILVSDSPTLSSSFPLCPSFLSARLFRQRSLYFSCASPEPRSRN